MGSRKITKLGQHMATGLTTIGGFFDETILSSQENAFRKGKDDYNEALQEKYPRRRQEQPFDGQIAYNIGRGLPHGRLAIGDGAVKKGTIIDAAKASGRRPATSRAFQNLMARYEESVATVDRLTQQNATLTRDVKGNGRVLEIEIPPDLLQEEENEM
ncbi:unnamed protein product [Miscanthus lutarioriparius]|uniref:Uncharacterized protein n=1 Tax=Miscanthus lutarioriparius TaxID=422564 RepID=A0A811SMY8_9POAL|nr:unnamed protein product [Miscanthus lutarioriparius]